MVDNLHYVLALSFTEILPAVLFLYAAYWAFSIRRVLVVPIYRSQALWLGVLCVLLVGTGWGLFTDNPIISNTSNVISIIEVLGIFAWADSTIRVARRSDPLLRSILKWEKTRNLVWIALGILTVLILLTGFSNSELSLAQDFLQLEIILLAFPTTAVLIIGARRTTDTLLRGISLWFGIFLLCVVGSVLGPFLESGFFSQQAIIYSYPAIPGIAITIFSAYALYRSARSLAPISRLSLEIPPR